MRSPNKEQKVAIEHNGGVLLNAGAGSGKTYVLVEHVHYHVSAFVENNKELTDLEFSKKLKSYSDTENGYYIFPVSIISRFHKTIAGITQNLR